MLQIATGGALRPEDTKIHLAVENFQNPLDLYREGTFQEWQTGQSRKNFERAHVVSFIELPEPHHWLFAGAYHSGGCGEPNRDGWYTYRLTAMRACKELEGRLVARFERPGRQSYLRAENWMDAITVSHIREEPLSVPEFPGFKGLHIRKRLLDLVVAQNHGAWKAALSSVAAVYLIADPKTGKFYVGSATGQGGLWQRWTGYASSGHGGNRDLKALLREMTEIDIGELQFSVLEIADTHAGTNEILERESHWKRVLLTQIHGLNPN